MSGWSLDVPPFFFFLFLPPQTYNLIRRRRAGDVALHLSSLPSRCILNWITGDDGRTCSGQSEKDTRTREWASREMGGGGKISATAEIRFKLLFLYKRIWMISKYQWPPLWTCLGFFFFFFNPWPADLLESTSYSSTGSETLKCAGRFSWPLTVSVTSVSPTPIRGTMALHTYWPASAWLTELRYSWLLLLRTCGGVEIKLKKRKRSTQI